MNQLNNKIGKVNKSVATLCSIIGLIILFIGFIGGMAIKNQRIDDAYERTIQNQKSYQELKEMVIVIDENVKFIKEQIAEIKTERKGND